MMNLILKLPTPSNINYMWNFGSLLGFCLISQILSGFFLSLYFKSDFMKSFDSVIHLMNDVNSGWMIRFIHSTGASFFFILAYFHIGKALMYSSYYYSKVWVSGLFIILFLMMEAFLGYVLPSGQMSYWGATVITNLVSVIPYMGPCLVEWLWGGFNVGEATLIRFFSFHFFLPFILIFFILTHIFFLHKKGSSNPLGLSLNLDKFYFSKFFLIKDLLTLIIWSSVLLVMSFKFPFVFMDPENFMTANPMVTPIHIQPEWYFLFAYSILRSIPSKMGGVILLVLSILIIIILPFLKMYKMKTFKFHPLKKMAFYFHIGTFMVLTWLGMQPVEHPFVMTGKIYSFFYFIYYLL
uniref:Cytochrome b n=1 Tax=Liposcelis nr. bostrychophila AZ TaxID=1643344 RepID=A0A0F6TMU0_9NEOP|nr:cytochrome b [Liposcelis nr. bostrychophila AZ]